MKENMVSIITPCYNSEAFLSRYLDSVLAQTYTNIQQIIVNDGSADNTEQIALSYKTLFENKGMVFTYVKQENQGLGAAINRGLREVNGRFFTWCDSDNFFSADYVEEKVEFFKKNKEYSIVRCDGYIVNEKDIHKVIGTLAGDSILDKTSEDLFVNCLLVKDFHFGCAMLRTCDFDKAVPDRKIFPSRLGQNWQLLLPMFYNYKSGYIDKPMFYFVEREDSISHKANHQSYISMVEQLEGHLEIIEKTLISMQIDKVQDYIAMARSKYYNLIMSKAFENKDKKLFRKYYRALKKTSTISNGTRDAYFELCYPVLYKIQDKLTAKRK